MKASHVPASPESFVVMKLKMAAHMDRFDHASALVIINGIATAATIECCLRSINTSDVPGVARPSQAGVGG